MILYRAANVKDLKSFLFFAVFYNFSNCLLTFLVYFDILNIIQNHILLIVVIPMYFYL